MPQSKQPKILPTKAKGKLIIIMAVGGMDLTERYMITIMTTKATAVEIKMFWVAFLCLKLTGVLDIVPRGYLHLLLNFGLNLIL